MARFMLRKDDPWMASAEADVRGWEVQDRDGRVLGQVEDVYFDPETGQIESIVTASGREFPASSYRIAENAVQLDVSVSTERISPPSRSHNETHTGDTNPAPGSFAARFRSHFDSTYGSAGAGTFADYLPAYRFGRMQALEPRFYARPFYQAEEDLQALYELHFRGSSYEAAREAIRFGYELGARSIPDLDPSILEQSNEGPPPFELDRNQIRPAAEEPDMEQAGGTASAMAIPGEQSDPGRVSKKK